MRATSEGVAIYASVSEAVGTLERAALALEPASATKRPKGVLRVTAPTDIGAWFLADVAVAFAERHPLVQIDLVLTNRAVNLVDEGLDVAVRASLRLTDSTLVAKKLGDVEHALYASPRYIDKHGTPSSPSDLAGHRCIVFRGKDLAKTWRLEGEVDGSVEVLVRAVMGGDDFSYVRAAALAGGGIALLPRLTCVTDEAAGRLVRVLPSLRSKGAGLYVLYPSSAHVPARVTAFRDFVAAEYGARMRQ